MPVEVPLWMAMALHKRRKCHIQPPAWMDIDNLKRALLKHVFWFLVSDMDAQTQRPRRLQREMLSRLTPSHC